jgi:hypothetical protein
MRTHRLERTVLWALPAAVLLASYVGVCVQAGTPWPWHRVVHEDGVHTLIGTVFYFEHASRELVPDAVLAVAVAGAVRYFFAPRGRSDRFEVWRWRRGLAWVTVVTLIAIVGGTVSDVGFQGLIDNLSQLHTRPGAPLVWGAHWRYHLIERFAQILLAFCAAGVIWMGRGRPDAPGARGRARLYGSALILFGAVTLLFRPTSEPFRDPAFLGHQLRELFTHTLVTLPLAVGMCIELTSIVARGRGARSTERVWPIAIAGVVSAFAGAFLLAASVATGAQAHGQTSSLAGLIFPHFFEHTMGYFLVPAMSGLIYLSPQPAWLP